MELVEVVQEILDLRILEEVVEKNSMNLYVKELVQFHIQLKKHLVNLRRNNGSY